MVRRGWEGSNKRPTATASGAEILFRPDVVTPPLEAHIHFFLALISTVRSHLAATRNTMTTSGTSSSSQVQPLAIRRSNHLITISHPHRPYYLVCILHFRDSLFVWLGEAPMGAVGEAQRSNSEQFSNGEASKEDEELLARAKASLSEEDQRQLEVDRQMEEELSKALAAAGRDGGGGAGGALEEDEIARQSKGFLAKEWAVAMYKEGIVSRCKAN